MLMRRKRPIAPVARETMPQISVVIATRDDAALVAMRVTNILESDYPQDSLHVIVALDATVGDQIDEYERVLGDRANVVVGALPGGKATALNAGVEHAKSEILVFADTAQTSPPSTISALVEELADERVGAVTGRYEGRGNQSQSLLRQFWRYEEMLRNLEYQVHSLVAVSGANLAMKTKLWRPLPPGLICDDLYVPFVVVHQGYRVGYRADAIISDPRQFGLRDEYRRKVRTLTGMLQMCAWEPRILSPRSNPTWLQFVGHKLLRLATPVLLLVIGLAGAFLSRSLLVAAPPTVAVLAAIALSLIVVPALRRRLPRGAILGVILLFSPLEALYNAAQGEWDVWR